jgi:hypothetical protein
MKAKLGIFKGGSKRFYEKMLMHRHKKHSFGRSYETDSRMFNCVGQFIPINISLSKFPLSPHIKNKQLHTFEASGQKYIDCNSLDGKRITIIEHSVIWS